MKSGHLLLLFTDPKASQIFIRWQIVELITRRVLGFYYDNSELTIVRSQLRQLESITNDLEVEIDEELGTQHLNYFDFLKKFRRMDFKEILKLTGVNHYEKRNFIDKVKNHWLLTESAKDTKEKITTELQSLATLSRKRNPNKEELYKKAKDIHPNIFELSVVLWNCMDFKIYKNILSQLNIKFISETMGFQEPESDDIYTVLDYMTFGDPLAEQRDLGLGLNKFPGPFDQGIA